jgi:membrane AbrB-like protein
MAFRWSFTVAGEEAHVPTMLAAFALGAAGGFAAKALGLPLPMLLGSLITVSAAAIGGLRLGGRVLGIPMPIRSGFVPVIGVSIGTAVTPGILEEATRWWPSVLALFVFIPLAHAISYTLTRRLGGLDKATSYYGTMPGGFIESIWMGDQAGADAAYLTMLQFLRLILCIVLIPIGFSLVTGHAVGSATGAVIGGAEHVLTLTDWAILIAAGVLGAWLGSLTRLPAYMVTGPFLLSAIVHYMGWVEGGPPGWLISLTQLVIGASLGARFAGRSPRILLHGVRLAGVNVAAMLILTTIAATALHGVVGERWEAVFLAFAPGGLAEMALVALSLEISVVYVTVHHILRIILAVFVARIFAAWALR